MSKTNFSTLAMIIHDALQTVHPGAMFKHIKSGNIYKVSEVSFRESDLALWVTYKPIDDLTEMVKFGRPMDEFLNKFIYLQRTVQPYNP